MAPLEEPVGLFISISAATWPGPVQFSLQTAALPHQSRIRSVTASKRKGGRESARRGTGESEEKGGGSLQVEAGPVQHATYTTYMTAFLGAMRGCLYCG